MSFSKSKLPKPSLVSHHSKATTTTTTPTIPRAPTSLLAGALPASLLVGDEAVCIPSRPRRLWTIEDTALKPIPQHYPPLNPRCTTYVGDASPSVVAVRITECFRKRSIAVEYDDEAITATALTVDRCLFSVQLWKGKTHPNGADFSHGVVVECSPISSSNTISFHYACRAILQAALGQSDGVDLRPSHKTNGLEFTAATTTSNKRPKLVATRSRGCAAAAAQGLEQAHELLKKDRLDTQLLGMERLVYLTSGPICGDEIAVYVSRQIIQQLWLLPYVISEEQQLQQPLDESSAACTSSSSSSGAHRLTACASSLLSPEDTTPSARTHDECRHNSRMRAFALRVFCNSLENLAASRGLLDDLLSPSLIQRPLLQSLVADLQGANRPPSVVEAGYQLASVHEAALALKCLRILGDHSSIVHDFLQSDPVLERLQVARTCGRATHMVLQQEAERTYSKVSEDVRSC